MTNIITKISLAAIVSLGAMGATSQANAGSVDVDIRIRTPHVRQPVVIIRPAPLVIVRPGKGRCSPQLALRKAYNRGLNRAAIQSIGPYRVIVSGKMRGMWTRMEFANVRGCPRF